MNDFFNLFNALEESIVGSLARNIHYWMVRTNGGQYYNAFRQGNFVALAIPGAYQEIVGRAAQFRDNVEQCKATIARAIPNNNRQDPRAHSLLVNHIYRIAFAMKEGDIVLMPSAGASLISIGRIMESEITRDVEIAGQFSLARRVEWITEIPKRTLDPCLYRALGAHQAISDVTGYKEYIERNYNSFFSLGDECHYVLTLNSQQINARSFAQLISTVLNVSDDISKNFELGINVNEVNMSTYLNSPGKIDLRGSVRNCLLLFAVVAALSGGEITYNGFAIRTEGLIDAVVAAINGYREASEQIREQKLLFDAAAESLSTKSVEQWNRILDEEEQNVQEQNENANDEQGQRQ